MMRARLFATLLVSLFVTGSAFAAQLSDVICPYKDVPGYAYVLGDMYGFYHRPTQIYLP